MTLRYATLAPTLRGAYDEAMSMLQARRLLRTPDPDARRCRPGPVGALQRFWHLGSPVQPHRAE